MTKRRKLIGVAGLVIIGAWVGVNRPGRFGICVFACTTYNSIPRPAGDMQVRADGQVRSVDKTHDLEYDCVEWLLDPLPEVLIISTGWSGVVRPDDRIRGLPDCQVRILRTPDAVKLFNKLKREKRKVAIHVHSTC